jgi:hypothetical protein
MGPVSCRLLYPAVAGRRVGYWEWAAAGLNTKRSGARTCAIAMLSPRRQRTPAVTEEQQMPKHGDGTRTRLRRRVMSPVLFLFGDEPGVLFAALGRVVWAEVVIPAPPPSVAKGHVRTITLW